MTNGTRPFSVVVKLMAVLGRDGLHFGRRARFNLAIHHTGYYKNQQNSPGHSETNVIFGCLSQWNG